MEGNLNYYAIGFDASLKFEQTLQNTQVTDTEMYAFAGSQQAKLGSEGMEFHLSVAVNGHPVGSYTMSQLNGFVLTAATDTGQSGAAKVQAAQAAYGRAGQLLNQYNTVAGGFTSLENNKATSADPTNIGAMIQVLGAFNQFLNQVGNLHVGV
jgi:hypothetical protein